VGVLVEGNQTMVDVGVSVEESEGVSVGMGVRPEQADRTSPQATRSDVKNCFVRIMSFIVSKTGRIVAQGVVQSNKTLLCLPFSSFYCLYPESGNQECL
jgi:hypothetical protein